MIQNSESRKRNRLESDQKVVLERFSDSSFSLYLMEKSDSEPSTIGYFVIQKGGEWRFFPEKRASGWSLSVTNEISKAASRFREGVLEPDGE